jgi:protein SCO1/2
LADHGARRRHRVGEPGATAPKFEAVAMEASWSRPAQHRRALSPPLPVHVIFGAVAPRLRLAVTVAAVCATVMVVIVIVSARSGLGTANGSPEVKVRGFYGATLPPSFPAVDFALPDQNHETIRLSAYAGQVVVATFIYSTCQNTCPIVVNELSQAINELPHPVPALAISVDPKQDTPANVQAFLTKEQVVGQLHYLVAARAKLAPIWKQFGIKPQTKINSSNSDHTVDLVIFDKTGRARVGYQDLTTMDPDAIAADIRALAAEPVPKTLPKRVDL